MKLRVEIGFPEPMGAKYGSESVNFAVAVPDGESCTLILYKKGTTQIMHEIPFTSEMMYGNVYAMAVYGLDIAKYDYNYRIGEKIVTDPYARQLSGTAIWAETKEENITSVIVDDTYDWEGDRPLGILFEDSIIYRAHVRGFTKHTSSKVKKKGTFAGIIEKIPYLKELGITMIELMPAYEFREVNVIPVGYMISEQRTVNYWGYAPANYFAVKASYAASGVKGGQIQEFCDLIKECHRNGIEVGMEFYFPEGTNQSLIMSCFRFWVRQYHIDGIHCNVANDIKTMLKQDPILGRTKLICYDWNEQDSYYYGKSQVSFKNLGECNDGFMVTARRFLKSDEGQLGDMSFQIKRNKSKVQSINYLANNDTLTVNDMVSYERKHNEANGENNRDGTEYNYTWNCGYEGKTRKRKVMELRKKQLRNAWAFLMFSQGTPMILAGDEFLHTTGGNNNPYCQDNEICWLNWNLLKKNQEMVDYVKSLIAFRNAHRILHMKEEMKNVDYRSVGLPDMSYHGNRAWYLDYNHLNRHFAVMYCGSYATLHDELEDEDIYIAYNMYWEPQTFGIPAARKGKCWKKVFATASENSIENESGEKEEGIDYSEIRELSVAPRSILVLVSEKAPEKPSKTKKIELTLQEVANGQTISKSGRK